MAARARTGKGKNMKWWLDRVAVLPLLVMIVFVLADFVLWESHPAAQLLGGAAGYGAEPLLLLPSIFAGALLKPDWRLLVIALVLGGVAEVLNMNNALREYEGRQGFDATVWLWRSLGSALASGIVALVKMGWQKVTAASANS